MMTSKPHILVLGAGVTGLTTSKFLAEAKYDVTVLARHFPGDESIEYTSPWAGAHWRTSATVNEPMVCDWDVQTFDYWVKVLENEKDLSQPKSGLKMQDSYHFWDSNLNEDIWWAPYVKDFKQLSNFSDPIASINGSQPTSAPQIRWGAVCRAPSIDVNQYLRTLKQESQSLGAQMIRYAMPTGATFEDALEAAEAEVKAHNRPKINCFINATGLSAMKLCEDNTMFPIKGQTVLVKGEASATRTRNGDGYTAYCIPRPGSGTTILGGTKDKGNCDPKPDPEVTKKILERNRYLAPELLTGPGGDFEVVSVQCGFRPGRRDGPRVEKEVVSGRRVVHAYGHASGGYQNSIGSARMVLGLVKEFLNEGQSRVASKL